MSHRPLVFLCVLCASAVNLSAAPIPDKIDFNRDVRPILSENCFFCHGPDKNKRKADLRLDTKAGIFTAIENKRFPAVPGHPQQSEIYKRIITTADEDRMPNPKSGKHLTDHDIAVLKKWIAQGAEFKGHWAYIKPVKPAVPELAKMPAAEAAGPLTAIDAFLLAKLREQNLSFSKEAHKRTLVRRLYFDLLGLPPTPAQVDAFVNDRAPDAYARLVDRLLSDPHFGERMAVYWLDLVRFADTIGYHSDNPRDIAPYRDWVISAFNRNMAFDQFTIEQLAGDLLPNPTIEQKVASGYNRLLQTTEEGGAQPKEYLAKYNADRVRNFSSVWMAATMGCCECHDHKFDPYSTREFYSMAAFFADVREPGVGHREPGMLLPDAKQSAELANLDGTIVELRKAFEADSPGLADAQLKWERAQSERNRPQSAAPAPGAAAGNTPPKRTGDRGTAPPAKAKAAATNSPHGSQAAKPLPQEVIAALTIDPAKRNDAQKKRLSDYFRGITPLLARERGNLAAAEKQRDALVKSFRRSLIAVAQTPRITRVLPRGNWNTDSGEIVAPAVPAFLPPLPLRHSSPQYRPTRLDLAHWVVSKDNPLTARVVVNRLWKLFYGIGISKSLEDLGSQGEWPTHPELLDYLACDFQEHGWDVKRMIRQMVMTRAYRQTSYASPRLREIDPFNRLYARQARFRLDAEFVRDNALSIAGLLADRIGGESVKPYQPAGYWDFLNFPTRTWVHDKGVNEYRRGLYTWWQRSFPQPSLTNFDAPSREECTAPRPISNTPQQALTLLNDPTYVEAARVFAQRIVKEGGSDVRSRLEWAWTTALARRPGPEEITVLSNLYEKHKAEYAADRKDAAALDAAGEAPGLKDVDPAELAAWTSIARTILNLHETITRS